MATVTVKHKDGTTASVTTTLTPKLYVVGPPKESHQAWEKYQGVYVKEVGTTYRWVRDEPVPLSSSVPTTYEADREL